MPPRAIWLMLPAGGPSEQVLGTLAAHCGAGRPGWSMAPRPLRRRAAPWRRSRRAVEFVDAGVSGGIWGLQNGYGLMVGGSEAAVARLARHCARWRRRRTRGERTSVPPAPGHYAKMVHNGIEYGLMQAYAEG